MTTGPAFLKNTWYVAAWSHEIGARAMSARTITQMPVLFWRDCHGKGAAIEDRCCHRAAPLSMGRREGENILHSSNSVQSVCAPSCCEVLAGR